MPQFHLGWTRPAFKPPEHLFLPHQPAAALPPNADLEAGCPPVYDQGNLGSCHDDQTEVLTKDGWVMFKDLQGLETLATVDPVSAKLVYEKPVRFIKLKYDGEVYQGKHLSLDFCVTPDHTMMVRKWDEANRTLSSEYSMVPMEKIGWYCGLMNKVSYDGQGEEQEYFVLKGVDHKHIPQRSDRKIKMDIWLKFLGLYLAEGTLIKPHKDQKHYKIQIAASKERERLFTMEILSNLGVKYLKLKDRFTFENKQIYTALEGFGLKGVKAPKKFVPRFVFDLPGHQIKQVLYGHSMGDGCDQDGFISHYTSSKQLADDIQLMLVLCGQWGNVYSRPPRTSTMRDGRIVKGKHPEYRVGAWNCRTLSIDRKEDIAKCHYAGDIFCAEMPTYHTLVTRRNGKILISGNCTANATSGLAQFVMKKTGHKWFMPSRLAIYYWTRKREGTTATDAGATLADAMLTLTEYGCPHESDWWYDPAKFAVEPNKKIAADGKRHRVADRLAVRQDVDQLRAVLADGYPVVFGFMVYKSFYAIKADGICPLPKKNARPEGGHAVLIVGYDDATNRFKVRNSWGTSWGDRGYFYMPYEYVTSPAWSDDFWTAKEFSTFGN